MMMKCVKITFKLKRLKIVGLDHKNHTKMELMLR